MAELRRFLLFPPLLMWAALAPADGDAVTAEVSSIKVKLFVVNAGDGTAPLLENAYVVYAAETRDAMIVDPGAKDARIESFVAREKLKVGKVLNTHGHQDHSRANRYFADLYHVPVAAHPADFFLFDAGEAGQSGNRPNEKLADGGMVRAGSLRIRVLHTPGHTPGSVCFLAAGQVLTGDTLFAGAIGKFFGEDDEERQRWRKVEIASIRVRLLSLSDFTWVFPGHGQATTIGDERQGNPFLHEGEN